MHRVVFLSLFPEYCVATQHLHLLGTANHPRCCKDCVSWMQCPTMYIRNFMFTGSENQCPMGAEGYVISFTLISVFKVLGVWKWFNLLGAKHLTFVEKTSALLSYRLCKESIRTSKEKPPILDYTVPCVLVTVLVVLWLHSAFAYPNSPHLPTQLAAGPEELLVLLRSEQLEFHSCWLSAGNVPH